MTALTGYASASGADAVLAGLGLDLPADTDSVVRANGLIAIRASHNRAELWAPADQADCVTRELHAHLPQATSMNGCLGKYAPASVR
jgi:tRNA-modifying protein YgfZ